VTDDGEPTSVAAPELDLPATAPEPVPLLAPRDGVPDVVESVKALDEAVDRLASGTGPVAVDAERASGYRYGQRAYLVQLRREGAGSVLIDPVPLGELRSLDRALADTEWVLHAASQDLPCLAELGMSPRQLFDTELAGRLTGHERVGLGPLVAEMLGYALEKGHSAADWSTRPLPEPWLQYAALDVEVLVDLRDALEDELREQGKLAWALEEFAAVRDAPPPAPRTDPWRRTSGIHKLRNRRQLALVRMLWEARDAQARRRDISPSRILPDTAIVAAATALPTTKEGLATLPPFSGRGTRRTIDVWWTAVQAAHALPDEALPTHTLQGDGPPPPRTWRDRNEPAAARLAAARAAVADVAAAHAMPAENVLAPDALRRVCWTPPADLDEAAVGAALRGHGARGWQVALTAPGVAKALQDCDPTTV
jgi:ribonuclease D